MDSLSIPLLLPYLSSTSSFLPFIHSLVLQSLNCFQSSLLVSDRRHALIVIATCFQYCSFFLKDIAEFVFESLAASLPADTAISITVFHTLTQLCFPQASFLPRFTHSLFAHAVELLQHSSFASAFSADSPGGSDAIRSIIILVEFIHHFIVATECVFFSLLTHSYYSVFSDFPFSSSSLTTPLTRLLPLLLSFALFKRSTPTPSSPPQTLCLPSNKSFGMPFTHSPKRKFSPHSPFTTSTNAPSRFEK